MVLVAVCNGLVKDCNYQQPTVINTAEDLEPLLAAITSMYNIVHFNMD